MPIDYTKRPQSPSTPTPTAGPTAQPVSPPQATGPVKLTKSAPTVSLTKRGQASGQLRVNLNWNARPGGPPAQGGFLKRLAAGASQSSSIDLDLGCLYELTDGSKGVVQALGNAFRNREPGNPIVWLDGDDRSGSNSAGENLFVDLSQLHQIRRILVFAFIYEGVPNWAAADGVVTLFPAQGPTIEVRLDEARAGAGMCGIAMLENRGGELSVSREITYVSGHDKLDQAYGWGMRWTAGRK
ncbi:TerD family protein [Terracoccus luteus]|uniref:Tellurite resistance protein TerA n=1 Tax=Terracoccus luteus TaxID=53356 RepID=A0A839Q0G6_9MICO|nr:tellurium resistance protein [Terracoccus luteus]MBB2988454.1 tellurite resistance protein TerA [Terracoccus luteus]MCP2174091.1 tellurite resistance protein TerA [Terracoccus luteus]